MALRVGGFAVEGAGGFAGEFQGSGGFAESDGLFLEDDGGRVAGVDGGGVGAAGGQFIQGVEHGADGGLGVPDGELGEGEFVGQGDAEKGFVGGHEVDHEVIGVDGDAVDLVVDGGCEVELAGLGFCNIVVDEIRDVTREKDRRIGKVASITIDKSPKFSKGDWIDECALIEISYHSIK